MSMLFRIYFRKWCLGSMGGSPGDVGEVPVTYVKQRKGCRLRVCLILQPFHRFTYITVHSPTLPSLHLRHSSYNPSVASTLELILQPFRRLTYATAHSTTLPSLHLRHSSLSSPLLHLRHNSFYNSSVASSTPQLILQPFRRFINATAHSTTLPSLHLRHSSFYNSSVASSTPQLILQHFRRFIYATAHSTTFPLLHLRDRHFTYFTWRGAHA